MLKFLKKAKRKVNGLIFAFLFSGLIFVFLGFLAVWSSVISQLILGTAMVILAAVFFYAGFRVWSLKREVEKYFKL